MKNWEKAESKVARAIHGKRVPGSGNGRLAGDITNKYLMVEMKETAQDRLTFKLAWLNKILMEALSEHRIPVFGIEFNNGSQIFLIRQKDISIEIVKEEDWTKKTTTAIGANSLVEGTRIKTISGYWITVSIEEVMNLSKECMYGEN